MKIRSSLVSLLAVLSLFFGACGLLPGSTPAPAVPSQAVEEIKSTSTEKPLITEAEPATNTPATPLPSPTVPTETVAPTATLTSSPEPSPIDTLTPTLTLTLAPTETQITKTGLPTALPIILTKPPIVKTQEMQSRIKTANILIFEDASDGGERPLMGRLDRVIEYMGITGGKVINTHERVATFDRYLKDGTQWDLIIIANESRKTFNTALITQAIPFMKQKTALIVEAWNLDEDNNTGASFIMDYCGIRVEKSWHRTEDYKLDDFLIYNFARYEPLLLYPNRINIPLRPTVYWMGDSGDLMNLYLGSRSRFAGGLISNDPSRYGVITVCDEGRVIVQTFSSHDYSYWDTISLWENYITHVLSNHFNTVP